MFDEIFECKNLIKLYLVPIRTVILPKIVVKYLGTAHTRVHVLLGFSLASSPMSPIQVAKHKVYSISLFLDSFNPLSSPTYIDLDSK
jgi:hypothetical protein